MTTWSSGYVSDISYTYGYYTELNPLRIKLAFLNSGLSFPEVVTACELGFGQGLSTNLHAAASSVRWYGTDFNPAQAAFAQKLAAVSGSDAQLQDDAFADFSQRCDLPEFDYIGLHGIWSWISDDNRRIIVDFIRRKLKVGGVLYVSYNTFPGWAAFAPMRHLMTEHAEVIGSEGHGIVSRIDDAIDFAEQLLATNPLFSRANPLVDERVKKLKAQNRHYLAHEYFNRDWHPMHFSTMADWLEPAKLQYACSAHYLDHIDSINLTPDQQAFLQKIPDSMFRESVRDFMTNQQFRRDYWVKGARRLLPLEQAEALRQQRIVLQTSRNDITLKVNGALGEASMTDTVYNPILNLMADHKTRTLGQIEESLNKTSLTFQQILQAAIILIGTGNCAPVLEEAQIIKNVEKIDKINQFLQHHARGNNDINTLASPVTGGGVTVGRFQQLFLKALQNGEKKPEEQAMFVWQLLKVQGQKLVKDGKTIEKEEDNIRELVQQSEVFNVKYLPTFKALKIS